MFYSIFERIFKIKYQVIERTWPERKDRYNLIVWWQKGNEIDGYWYKADGYYLYGALGQTVDEAINEIIDESPVWIWELIWRRP